MKPLIVVLLLLVLKPISTYAVCVTASKANLRKGPGSKYQISWTVGKYTPLLDIQQKGGWLQVEDQDGEKHWVYRSLVSKTMQCLSIKSRVTALRKGPGRKKPLADVQLADRYSAFKYIDSTDYWFHVEDQWGQRFWVARQNVWRAMKMTRLSF